MGGRRQVVDVTLSPALNHARVRAAITSGWPSARRQSFDYVTLT
jgi:hypothetical protein